MTTALFECSGAPRDLGRDQARACPAKRPAAASRWAQRWRSGAGIAHVDRDLARHQPQQSETLDALARGAGLPRVALIRALVGACAADRAPALALLPDDRSAPALGLCARGIPADAVVRRSRPDGCFASVEITRPFLTHALLGVNEHGLVALSVSGAVEPGAHAVPAALLVQDCLARFDSSESALAWCLRRPGAGATELLLLDVGGDAVGIEFEGSERRVRRPAARVLCAGALRGREVDLDKEFGLAEAPGDEVLRAALFGGAADVPVGAAVWASPERRSLRIDGAWIGI